MRRRSPPSDPVTRSGSSPSSTRRSALPSVVARRPRVDRAALLLLAARPEGAVGGRGLPHTHEAFPRLGPEGGGGRAGQPGGAPARGRRGGDGWGGRAKDPQPAHAL